MSTKNTINQVFTLSCICMLLTTNSYMIYKINKRKNEDIQHYKITMEKLKKQEEYMTKDIADMIIEVNN